MGNELADSTSISKIGPEATVLEIQQRWMNQLNRHTSEAHHPKDVTIRERQSRI